MGAQTELQSKLCCAHSCVCPHGWSLSPPYCLLPRLCTCRQAGLVAGVRAGNPLVTNTHCLSTAACDRVRYHFETEVDVTDKQHHARLALLQPLAWWMDGMLPHKEACLSTYRCLCAPQPQKHDNICCCSPQTHKRRPRRSHNTVTTPALGHS